MLKKNDIKLIRSLRLKKYRQKYNKFIVEGEKNSVEALKNVLDRVDSIYCTIDFFDKNQLLFVNSTAEVVIVSDKELKQISNLKSANSVVLILNKKQKINIDLLKKSKTIVYLDDITDPGNMGTIIRSCDWFDVDALVTSINSVDIYNPKVIQSSMGSIFRLPIFNYEFNEMQEILSGYDFTFYGTKLQGDSINAVIYNYPMVIVVGNESKGISDAIDKKLNHRITIPRYNKNTESLNAAVATAIVLYEIKRMNIKERATF